MAPDGDFPSDEDEVTNSASEAAIFVCSPGTPRSPRGSYLRPPPPPPQQNTPLSCATASGRRRPGVAPVSLPSTPRRPAEAASASAGRRSPAPPHPPAQSATTAATPHRTNHVGLPSPLPTLVVATPRRAPSRGGVVRAHPAASPTASRPPPPPPLPPPPPPCSPAPGASPTMTPSRRRRRRAGTGGGLADSTQQMPTALPAPPAVASASVDFTPRTVVPLVAGGGGGHPADMWGFPGLPLGSFASFRWTRSRIRIAVIAALVLVSVARDETPASGVTRRFMRMGGAASFSVAAVASRADGERSRSANPPPAFGIDHGREIELFPARGAEDDDDDGGPAPAVRAAVVAGGGEVVSGTERTDQAARGTSGAAAANSRRDGGGGGGGGRQQQQQQRNRRVRRPVLSFARAALTEDVSTVGRPDAMPIFRPSGLGPDGAGTLHPRERIIHGGHEHAMEATSPPTGKTKPLKQFVLADDPGVADLRAAAAYGAPLEGGRRSHNGGGGVLGPVVGMLVCLVGVATLALLFGFGKRKRTAAASRTAARATAFADEQGGGEGIIRPSSSSEDSPTFPGGRKRSRDRAHRTL